MYNCACDLEANCYIDRSKMQKEAGGLFCADFGFDTNLGSIAYYDLLKNNAIQQPQEQVAVIAVQPCNDGQGGDSVQVAVQGNNNNSQEETQAQAQSGNTQVQPTPQQAPKQSSPSQLPNPTKKQQVPLVIAVNNTQIEIQTLDDHSQWPKDADNSTIEQLKMEVEALVAFAAEEVEKNQGTIPGEMKGLVDRIRKKPKLVTDWKRYCRRYLGNEYTYLTKKSRRRESMRFPDAAGTRHMRKARILVAIDTSGSVSMPEYREFMGQILTMKEKANFRILECDAIIQREYEFNGKIREDLKGGGGTSFQPVVDYFIKNQREYDCLVYFTDGYASIPSNTPKDTLWVVSSKGDHTREKYAVNGAHSVFIPAQTNE